MINLSLKEKCVKNLTLKSIYQKQANFVLINQKFHLEQNKNPVL